MTSRLAALATFVACFVFVAGLAAPLFAQSDWPPYPSAGGEHDIVRGAGGYFSWIKLLLIVVIFLAWVKAADWINRDAVRFSEHTGMSADVFNPIIVFSFVAGFLAVLCIPIFIAGYAVYLAGALLPPGIYALQRRGRIPEEAKTGKLFAEDVGASTVPVTIKAAGRTGDESQSNLIRARQSPVFDFTSQMLLDAINSRTDQILLDYTRDTVAVRNQVDGIWHQMPVLDRESGDGVLWVLKTLSNLNPAERRQQQRGQIDTKAGREKVQFDITTQGVPTGERVLIKLLRETKLTLDLEKLGMATEMLESLKSKLDSSGLVIISAPPGQGLSASWGAALNEADRFTRDFVGVVELDDRETERENIHVERLDIRGGNSPSSILKTMILKQPNAFVMPNLADKETTDMLTSQVVDDQRTLITQVQASSAPEAMLRVFAMAGDRGQLAKAVTAVTCQRLVRRLCDKCKQPVQVNPQAIQQIGGDPEVHTVIYRDYQLPPMEQRVDEQGKPVHMEPCKACAGIGFRGRTAIYELLLVDDPIRQALVKSPKLETITQVAQQSGNLTLMQQGYRAVLEGRTSLAEVQRVLQPQQQGQAKR
ncbi:MAG: ATPase, T2SS/T4P/T4SS family [Pirellulaceae bacterium]